nr:hypothetical protein [uncultured Rhodopila sp.]
METSLQVLSGAELDLVTGGSFAKGVINRSYNNDNNTTNSYDVTITDSRIVSGNAYNNSNSSINIA